MTLPEHPLDVRQVPAAPNASTPGVQRSRRITYISWAESCSRSDHTARELGGTSHTVYAAAFGSRPSTVMLKYAAQWLRTARILRQEQPETVFVMTPPLFAAIPAFCYAKRHGARVVLDAHTAAFMHPRWRRWQWLQQALYRRAATTLVHNAHLAEMVKAAGGHATVVPDVPVIFAAVEPFARPPEFTVAAVCSFNYDEPIEAILEAAAALPDVRFFLTGNPRHLRGELIDRCAPNVALTGFLSTAVYGGLLQAADVGTDPDDSGPHHAEGRLRGHLPGQSGHCLRLAAPS